MLSKFWKNFTIALVFLIIFALLALPLVRKLARSRGPGSVTIETGSDPGRKFCHAYPVRCDGKDADFCSNTCLENLEYSCQPAYDVKFDPTTHQGTPSLKGKFCLPEKRAFEYPCDIKKGCVPVWSGWASTNRMEWDSLCMYPNYFGGNGCTVNPGICELNGNNFMDMSKDYSASAPTSADCKLPQELKDFYEVMERPDDRTPMIVLKSQRKFYTDES